MKFENIKATSAGEVKKALGKLIATKRSQGDAAKEIGMDRSHLNMIMNGHTNIGRKALEYFGLEARTVYVKKGGE